MFKRGKMYFVKVPLSTGATVKKTTGTTDKQTARLIEAFVRELASKHEWALLDAVTGGDRRTFDRNTGHTVRTEDTLPLEQLYAARVGNGLAALKARLADVDLAEHVEAWQEWLRSELGASETVSHYLAHVRTLIRKGKPFLRSELTPPRIAEWLNALPVSSSTRRKYRAALASFATYLTDPSVGVKVLTTNPVREVRAPKAGKPRTMHLEQGQVLELLLKLPEPYRTLEALIHGTGMEISAALAVRRSDVDALAMTARARGTKTAARDRTCAVSEWAWPYVERHLAAVPEERDALLFPGISRYAASDVHREACKALGGAFTGYRIHDARHTYAVRLARAGAPMAVAAKQLGHSSTAMVAKVYAVFAPNVDEVRKWERLAAVRDEEVERHRTRGRIARA
jgi:integrase